MAEAAWRANLGRGKVLCTHSARPTTLWLRLPVGQVLTADPGGCCQLLGYCSAGLRNPLLNAAPDLLSGLGLEEAVCYQSPIQAFPPDWGPDGLSPGHPAGTVAMPSCLHSLSDGEATSEVVQVSGVTGSPAERARPAARPSELPPMS